MPNQYVACDAMKYLSTEGLPSRLQWRYPPRGPHFDLHVVDFDLVGDPRQMADILARQDTPAWFIACEGWSDFLAIGTWERTFAGTGFKMKWHICVNVNNGRIFRIESSPDNLRVSLKSNEEMAASIEDGGPPIEPIKIAHSECVVFINSSPRQLTQSFEIYFSFVNTATISAREFLESISGIDRLASENGAMWYLLVADSLNQDEY